MKKILFTALVISVLSACATTGTQIGPDKLAQLKPGITTIADAEQLLGQSMSVQHNYDGTTQLDYLYSAEQTDAKSYIPIAGAFIGKGNHTQSQNTLLLFDKDGKYLKWSSSSMNN